MLKRWIFTGLIAFSFEIHEYNAETPISAIADDEPSKCLYRYANLKISVNPLLQCNFFETFMMS